MYTAKRMRKYIIKYERKTLTWNQRQLGEFPFPYDEGDGDYTPQH
jgi:hypothetical protein